MAEIRSTLDLVMEKTRHLQMTEEDKRKQAVQTFKETVNGLTGKFLDGQINLERFRDRFDQLEKSCDLSKIDAVTEICRRIDPACDNRLLLDLMRDGFEFDISGIETTLKHFQEKLFSDECRTIERIKSELRNTGISGNAVIPNLELNEEWAKKRIEMFEAVKLEISGQIEQIKRD